MAPPALWSKLKENTRGKAAAFVSGIAERLQGLSSALAGGLQAGGRIYVIAGLGVMGALLLVLVILLAVRGGGETAPASALRPEITDFFLPEEPDAVPPVILEREPRRFWTEEDAAPFWTDPLERGEEPWRERVEAAVDRLFEGVP
jgi:hypothetical protein